MNTALVLAKLGLGSWEYDERGRRRPGAWSQTYSGAQFWPLDPREEEVHFDDICMGLRELRYRSQTREPYSVSTHSVLVSIEAERLGRAWATINRHHGLDIEAFAGLCARQGLLHDAPEAYIGDIARPLKRQSVMRGYRRLEAKWEGVIFRRFGIEANRFSHAIVEEADKRIVLDEIEALMIDPDMWPRNGRYIGLEPLGIEIPDWTWQQSVDAFCQRFCELWPDWPETVAATEYVKQNSLGEEVFHDG